MARPLLRAFLEQEGEDAFILADALRYVPTAALSPEDVEAMAAPLLRLSRGAVHHRITALGLLEHLLPLAGTASASAAETMLQEAVQDSEFSVRFLAVRILRALDPRTCLEEPVDPRGCT